MANFETFSKRKLAKLERLTSVRKREWLQSGKDHGFVRLYAPVGTRSLVYPVTLATTAQDICSVLGFESIYLQIGGSRIRSLATGERPLHIQNEILSNIGRETKAECMNAGDATHLTHIFCFFIGRPEQATDGRASREILLAWCDVRKGRLLHKWSKRRCTLYNGTIRIEYENADDEILLLSRYRTDVAEGSRGKYLRLTDSSNIYCLHFDAIGEMNLWFSRLLQTQIAPSCDLSDNRLLLLPDELFSVNVNRQVSTLNLRRNSLQFRPKNQIRSSLLGWLDDLGRLHALRSLNIADNSLYHFPNAVTCLKNLTELILSGNRITSVPLQMGELTNLTSLNLSNNWLKTIPNELSRCLLLSKLDLSFNRFDQIPDVFLTLKRVSHLEMAGNNITSSALQSLPCIHVQKIALRRNNLIRAVQLTSFICCVLTELDIRDNVNLSELDLTNLATVQTIHCERLQLTNLQVNGTNLRYLYADHNDLSQAIIMPVPVQLIVFSIAHNHFSSLPEWLTDLPQIETISAHHNLITYLPQRIFMNVSKLKNLYLHHNQIERLPEVIENCSLEILSLYSNRIDELPNQLLRAAHKLKNLNVSYNRLKKLPPANTMLDLNRLQILRAASNLLDETVISVVVNCRRLRILDLSYNQLKFFDDSCLRRLIALEEVNLAANCLISISATFGELPNLQSLRVHSNDITTVPDLSQSPQLFLLDISNNELAHLDTDLCLAKPLKHLDLTCNYLLQVDTNNIRPKKHGRAVSVVNVGNECNSPTYHFGFCESTGHRNKLCIRQIRPNANLQSIFGIVDGGNNDHIATLVIDKITDFFQKQRFQTSSAEKSLKMALIYAHEHLGATGERLGAAAMLLKLEQRQLFYACVGSTRAVLCRSGNAFQLPERPLMITCEDYTQLRTGNATITQDNVIDGICLSANSLGFSFLYPAVLPKTFQETVTLTEADEFIVIGAGALWKYISPQNAIDSIRGIYNPHIAAKKLQDMLQTFEYSGNVSIIVIRFKRSQQAHNEGETILHKSIVKAKSTCPINDMNTLRNIEERLEQISEAINKIDDDSNNHRSPSSGLELWNEQEYLNTNSNNRRSCPMSSNNNNNDLLSASSTTTSRYSASSTVSPCSIAPPDPHSDRSVNDRFSIRKRIDLYDRLNVTSSKTNGKEKFQRVKSALNEQLQLRTPEGKIMKLYNV